MLNKQILFSVFLFGIIISGFMNNVWAQTISDVIKPKVDRELQDEHNDLPGKAVVLVYSNTSWSGTVSGGDLGSSTKEGKGDAKFVVSCGDLGLAQGLIQKNTEGGFVAVVIIQNTKILAVEATNAQFGIAHAVSDNCSNDANVGGGCLIATAAYGTELAPQVQFLREIRDNTLMSTASGTAFMTAFNQAYYSFSPTIADLERENPFFQEAVRAFITPMISSLSIMTLADDGSEADVLGLGISIITLNLGMYIAAPAVIGFKIHRYLKPRY